MERLETTLCGRRVNPFYGTAAADYTRVIYNGDEIEDYRIFSDLSKQGLLGFVETKTETIDRREGNPQPRFAWTQGFEQGIQSMGLPCVGIYNYPYEKCNVPTITSFAGKNKEESKVMTQYLDEKAKKNKNIIAADPNGACPNVPGCPSCYKEDFLEHLKVVRENTKLPVLAKIGYFPEEEKLIQFGKKVDDIGIDGLIAINSPPGMGIDAETGKSVVKKYGGVFGRGLKPLALRTINILHENTDLKNLVGVGGIYEPRDAIEFLLAGANAVQLSSRLVKEACPKDNENDVRREGTLKSWVYFLKEFKNSTESFMKRKRKNSIEDFIGKLEK